MLIQAFVIPLRMFTVVTGKNVNTHSDFERQALVSTATWSRQLKIQPIQVNVPGASRASFKCMRTSSDRTFPSSVA